MGDRTGQLAEGRDARGVAKISLQLSELGLDAEAFRHIFEAENCRVEFEQRLGIGDRKADVEQAAVKRAYLHIFAVILAPAESPDHDAAQRVRAFGEQISDRPAYVLYAGAADEFDRASIDVGDRNA